MKKKPKHLVIISAVVFLLGLAMIVYWTKYILDGLPLTGIPLLPEGTAAVLALVTGVGLFLRQRWALPAGFVLAGFWLYGCFGGINLVLYELTVNRSLGFQSPIGALTDAVLFFLITAFAVFLTGYLWRTRRLFLSDDHRSP